jgi:hypothetical protein
MSFPGMLHVFSRYIHSSFSMYASYSSVRSILCRAQNVMCGAKVYFGANVFCVVRVRARGPLTLSNRCTCADHTCLCICGRYQWQEGSILRKGPHDRYHLTCICIQQSGTSTNSSTVRFEKRFGMDPSKIASFHRGFRQHHHPDSPQTTLRYLSICHSAQSG